VQHKCLLGSKMLKLNNRDEDWVIFVDENAKITREKGCKSIPFYKAMHDSFIRGTYIQQDPYNALFIYQMSAKFHEEEDYPFNDFNILEHKEVWIKWLKAYMNDEMVEQKAISQDILRKQFYNILYQYHMIKENTHWISEEARVDVQKIHDLEMPSSYFYILKDLINSL
jgi:predicted DNA-binding protein (MmcQ/YjbR family)